MVSVEMICYKIEELNMRNRITETQTMRCINRDHFSVEYKENLTVAIATLTEYVEMEEYPSQFCIKLVLEAVFLLDGVKNKSQKETAHRKCYNEMFPYAAQIIHHLTVDSGMSGGVTIERQQLKQVNFGSKPQEKSGKVVAFPTRE